MNWRSRLPYIGFALVIALIAVDPRLNWTLFSKMESFTAQTPIAVLQDSKVLPRNIALKTFDPHRPDFTCVHEAPRVPHITIEGQALYQQGLLPNSPALWTE